MIEAIYYVFAFWGACLAVGAIACLAYTLLTIDNWLRDTVIDLAASAYHAIKTGFRNL